MTPLQRRKSSWVGPSYEPRPVAEWELTLPPKPSTKDEIEGIGLEVLRALDEEWPKLKTSSLLSTWKDRDRIMRGFGPPMVLLHWVTLAELGRIPHSSEGHAVSLEQAAELAQRSGKRFFIEMFSHRWVRPDHPDDEEHCKAYSLVQWAKYRWSLGMDVFFWIDYSCINQHDILPGVTMLPLYVSSCNNIICYDTPDYEARAWCRLERLMFAAFVAPNNEFLEQDFVYDSSAERAPNGELIAAEEGHELLPDPDCGELSMKEDYDLIHDLKLLCSTHWAKCWKDGLLQAVEKKAGLGRSIRELEFGKTKVRMRKFVSNKYSSCWKAGDRSSQSTEASDPGLSPQQRGIGGSPRSDLGVSRHASTHSAISTWEAGSWQSGQIGHRLSEPAPQRFSLFFNKPSSTSSWGMVSSSGSESSWWPFCSSETRCCSESQAANTTAPRLEGISRTHADSIDPYSKSGTWR
mmetsp:Transcript_34830/g.81338  ORF Transcript_34830/g.81338 Transcript_34830/m.81338 type:complete len:463 (-) Transcript_34830:77-1465(-)